MGILRTDADGATTYVNRKWCELSGLSADEALGNGWLGAVHPDDRENLKAGWEDTSRRHEASRTEYRIVRPDGSIVWVIGQATPERNTGGLVIGYIGTIVDIDERKRVEEALRESERFATATLDALSMNLCVVNEAGTIVTVNRAWREFAVANLAADTDVSEGANYLAVCDAVVGADAGAACSMAAGLRGVLSGKRQEFTLDYSCDSPSEERWFIGRVTPFGGKGPPRAVVAHHDITARHTAEAQLRAEREHLRALASQLSASEEKERRRIAAALHEQVGQHLALSQLRLAALRKTIRAAGPVGAVDEVRAVVDEAMRATRSLTSDLAPPVLYRFGLAAAVEWYGERLNEQTGLTVQCSQRGTPPPLGDDILGFLFAAVRELLFNVVKHAHTDSARVVLDWRGEVHVLTVEDDGSGFEPEAGAWLLDARDCFGLFSIRERLHDLGGRLEIESAPGTGTRASLVIPMATRALRDRAP